ncbi:hypothetical protein HPB51_025336 [Rhipicephalus microplus]|uniref:Uncharacterized protein n=1 Tax=Rhipicephalus microplus TaxID=6941 RepID=A0A9J6DDJ7_RHIMP|nr:hypothetical protein HPB51_025336 [Rhipicephalus microplus]
MIGRRLVSTGSAPAEADAQSLQELEVVPDVTLKGPFFPFFKQAPPHVENFGDRKAPTMKEGEDLKPKMSVGAMGKQKDKGETEAESEGKPKKKNEGEAQAKEKQINSQPSAVRTYSEAEKLKVNPTAEETARRYSEEKKNEEDEETAQGQKATRKEEGEVAEDQKSKNQPSQDDKTKDKPLKESGKSAGEQTQRKSEQPWTNPNEDSEPKQPKPTEPDYTKNIGDAGANSKKEPPQTGQQKSIPKPDQASKPQFR